MRKRAAGALAAIALALGCGPKIPPLGMERSMPLEGWLQVRSPGLEILSAAGEARTLQLTRDLQIFAAVLRRLTGASSTPRVPLEILLFPDRESYKYFGMPWAMGELRESTRGYLLTLSPGRAFGRSVLFHEYVHFLLHNQGNYYPRWYHEGQAELLGSASIREHLFTFGTLAGRELVLAREDLLLPWDEVLALRDYQDAGRRLDAFYAQSWLLAHRLQLGHLAGYPRRADALERYLAALQTGSDWRAAFASEFPEGLDALARDLESYRQRLAGGGYLPQMRIDVRELPGIEYDVASRSVTPEDVAVAIGSAYLDLGEPAARYAERTFARALERDPQHARALAGSARAHALLGDFDAARGELARAAALAPDDAFVLRAGGAVLLIQAAALADSDPGAAGAARAAARVALRRATQREPGVPEADVLLGRSYLDAGGDVAEGLAALGRAQALLPWNDEINLDLARLCAQAGQPERARLHVERALRTSRGERREQAQALRDELERPAPNAPHDTAAGGS